MSGKLLPLTDRDNLSMALRWKSVVVCVGSQLAGSWGIAVKTIDDEDKIIVWISSYVGTPMYCIMNRSDLGCFTFAAPKFVTIAASQQEDLEIKYDERIEGVKFKARWGVNKGTPSLLCARKFKNLTDESALARARKPNIPVHIVGGLSSHVGEVGHVVDVSKTHVAVELIGRPTKFMSVVRFLKANVALFD